jgi:excisionase family DNA binding protein
MVHAATGVRVMRLPLAERICLTPREAADALGCRLALVQAAIRDGTLGPARTIGGGRHRSLIKVSAILEWFDSQPVTPSSKKESLHG